MDAASVASNLTPSRKATANGDVAVVCVHRDDVAALAGDAVCVLDQPGLQVVVAGRSTMALTADNVVDTLLKGVTVRQGEPRAATRPSPSAAPAHRRGNRRRR